MNDTIIMIAAAVALLCFFAMFIFSSIQSRGKDGKGGSNAFSQDKPEPLTDSQEDGQTDGQTEYADEYTDSQEDGIDIPPYMEMRATVVDMHCQVRMVGLKEPKTVTEFCVCFENDEGKVFAVPVDEEMYTGFEKGQRGVLKLYTEDVLYSFEPFEEK